MDPRTPYPSDLSPTQWAQVRRSIPAPKPGGRPVKHDRLKIVNVLLYIARTGRQWRALPHDFLPWTIVYWYFCCGGRRSTGLYGAWGERGDPSFLPDEPRLGLLL